MMKSVNYANVKEDLPKKADLAPPDAPWISRHARRRERGAAHDAGRQFFVKKE